MVLSLADRIISVTSNITITANFSPAEDEIFTDRFQAAP